MTTSPLSSTTSFNNSAFTAHGTPTFRDKDGNIFLAIGFQVTMYFDQGLASETRSRVAECLDAFLAVPGPSIRWITTPDGQDWQQFSDKSARAARKSLSSPVDETWELQLTSSELPNEASEYQFDAFGQDQASGRLSYLRVSQPMGDVASTAPRFAELVQRISRILRPLQGYGGIAFLESNDPGVKSLGQPAVYSLAQRFPGIEVDRPIIHLRFLEHGIKGVNWLTVLGSRWIEAVGGTATLRAKLPSTYVFDTYEGGLIIRSGPEPQTGDRNQRIWPKVYSQLSRVLKPIRIKEHDNFDYDMPHRFTADTTIEWLNRFDHDPW
jgi:hypothetical protein